MNWQKIREGYYTFTYWDQKLKKKVKLPISLISKMPKTDEEADEFCNRFEATRDASKARILRRLKWKKKYIDKDKVLQEYIELRKYSAPNSWKQDLYYLEQYAFHWFLDIANLNNLRSWSDHYEQFRDWLKTTTLAKTRKKKSTRTEVAETETEAREALSWSTRNSIIKALNAFMAEMKRRGQVPPETLRCRMFEKWRLKKRSLEDIVPVEDFKKIHAKLIESGEQPAANFFETLFHGGFRLNEGLGISLADVFEGEPNDETLKRAFKTYGITCYGYIRIDSQPSNEDGKIRNEEGLVSRKPLKGRREISPKMARIIPIIDKVWYNNLVEQWSEQQKLFEIKKFGPNEKNYLLYDGLTGC